MCRELRNLSDGFYKLYVYGSHTCINIESDTESLPWDPVGSLAVNPISSAAWHFTIDIFQASPTYTLSAGNNTVPPVAFLLRIELISSQTFSFKWAVS